MEATDSGQGFTQPLSNTPAAVDPVTGIYTWNTTGAAIHPTMPTLYSTQVMIDDGQTAVELTAEVRVSVVT